jgi:hypothetical protein
VRNELCTEIHEMRCEETTRIINEGWARHKGVDRRRRGMRQAEDKSMIQPVYSNRDDDGGALRIFDKLKEESDGRSKDRRQKND